VITGDAFMDVMILKIWKDFYDNKNNNYCLIFEDDFVSNENCKEILFKAELFMKKIIKKLIFYFYIIYLVNYLVILTQLILFVE
jgi:GR25 family glycosyltransferase involved in LPS biosynthesis